MFVLLLILIILDCGGFDTIWFSGCFVVFVFDWLFCVIGCFNLDVCLLFMLLVWFCFGLVCGCLLALLFDYWFVLLEDWLVMFDIWFGVYGVYCLRFILITL